MKIRDDHYDYIKQVIKPIDTEYRRNLYRNRQFPNAERTKDLDMRYRWDLLYTCCTSKWVCDNLYPYMNDSHIETALKRIVSPL
jgi:hypothetical protein